MRRLSTTLFASLILQAAGVLSGILAARLLGPEGRGELAAIVVWSSIVAVLGGGGLYDAVTYAAATRSDPPPKVLVSSTCIAVGISVLLLPLALFAVPFLFPDFTPDLQRLASAYFVLAIPLILLIECVSNLCRGMQLHVEWNILRSLASVVYAGGVLVLWWAGRASVESFIVSLLFAYGASASLALALAALRGWLPAWPRWATLTRLLQYGAKVHIGGIGREINQWLDRALISLVLSSADLGLYVVALTVASSLQILAATIGMLAFADISQHSTFRERNIVLGRYCKITLLAVLPCSAVLVVIAPLLLRLAFGAEFVDAAPVVYLLILANIAASAKLLLTAGLKAFDRPLLVARVEAFGVPVAAGSLLGLMAAFGLLGGAAGVVLTQAFTCGLMAYWMRRELGIKIGRLVSITAEDRAWLQRKLLPPVR